MVASLDDFNPSLPLRSRGGGGNHTSVGLHSLLLSSSNRSRVCCQVTHPSTTEYLVFCPSLCCRGAGDRGVE